jgi:hypothetical protein
MADTDDRVALPGQTYIYPYPEKTSDKQQGSRHMFCRQRQYRGFKKESRSQGAISSRFAVCKAYLGPQPREKTLVKQRKTGLSASE